MLASKDVPAHTVLELAPRATQYCILIPVINEGARIQAQLKGMSVAGLGADIVVVDGGSTDGSLAEPYLRAVGVRVLLTKTGPGKLSAQLRVGFHYALEQGYKGVVTIDGNGKDDFTAIPAFISQLENGVGHVQGSRYAPGGRGVNTPRDRELALKLLHAPLISLAAGVRYTDTTNGFRGYSRALLEDPQVQVFRALFDTYNLHYYLAVRAPRLGYRVSEVGVVRAYPDSGKIPSKISGVRGKLHILKQLLLAVTGAYNPK